jgi:hypothetical protein
MVTVPVRFHLGVLDRSAFPIPVGADDAARAEWVRADNYLSLVDYLASQFRGRVFRAHEQLLTDLFGGR